MRTKLPSKMQFNILSTREQHGTTERVRCPAEMNVHLCAGACLWGSWAPDKHAVLREADDRLGGGVKYLVFISPLFLCYHFFPPGFLFLQPFVCLYFFDLTQFFFWFLLFILFLLSIRFCTSSVKKNFTECNFFFCLLATVILNRSCLLFNATWQIIPIKNSICRKKVRCIFPK